ncbi:MAG: type III pantothenate kinase [Gammaproteobacteria bacterium]|nr:type III pantothenate kinase [Gammaproteobacteria bacterium]
MCFLAVDIGNTRLKWALYEHIEPTSPILNQGSVYLEQIDSLAEHHWKQLPIPTSMLGCVVANKAVKNRTEEQLELWDINPQWVVPNRTEAGVVNLYEQPHRLGADRWLAIIGARSRLVRSHLPFPRPILVIMVGTAVTIEAISANGEFLGGYILPGHGLMLKALESGTAGLYVPTGVVQEFPRNTSDALTSGGTYAIAGAVEIMYKFLQKNSRLDPVCYMTGGAASKVLPYVDLEIQQTDSLIFEGLLEVAYRRQHRHTNLMNLIPRS